MTTCRICGISSRSVAEALSVCGSCIRDNPGKAMPIAMDAHRQSRAKFNLPESPPHDPSGVPCDLCVNQCRVSEGEIGFCGLKRHGGEISDKITPDTGKLSWYHDPLPTNCVGDWVCAGGTGAGFPDYANCQGPERGYKNLAVFFHACSFNCLYCQNWQFRKETTDPKTIPVQRLVSRVDSKTSCICYFGGDPTPQLPFSIKASRLALEKSRGRILRVCWETNGSMNEQLLDQVMDLAIQTGGCIKFDLKAGEENLHLALTGVTNRQTLSNFKRAGQRIKERPDPPPLIAGTLLVPGYIDVAEIQNLARFIASVNPDIPYSLLAFHPQFYMTDLPLPSRQYALGCLEAAKEEGLNNVRIGNLHLLM
jgi:pyruvate formate lyase activating enzyme